MISLAMTVWISMTAPTLNEDGSELVDLYQICLYDTKILNPVDCQLWSATGELLSFTRFVDQINDRKCFYATAIDESGNESVPSGTVCTKRYRCYSCHSDRG